MMITILPIKVDIHAVKEESSIIVTLQEQPPRFLRIDLEMGQNSEADLMRQPFWITAIKRDLPAGHCVMPAGRALALDGGPCQQPRPASRVAAAYGQVHRFFMCTDTNDPLNALQTQQPIRYLGRQIRIFHPANIGDEHIAVDLRGRERIHQAQKIGGRHLRPFDFKQGLRIDKRHQKSVRGNIGHGGSTAEPHRVALYAVEEGRGDGCRQVNVGGAQILGQDGRSRAGPWPHVNIARLVRLLPPGVVIDDDSHVTGLPERAVAAARFGDQQARSSPAARCRLSSAAVKDGPDS